jgi:hypothetical protein
MRYEAAVESFRGGFIRLCFCMFPAFPFTLNTVKIKRFYLTKKERQVLLKKAPDLVRARD